MIFKGPNKSTRQSSGSETVGSKTEHAPTRQAPHKNCIGDKLARTDFSDAGRSEYLSKLARDSDPALAGIDPKLHSLVSRVDVGKNLEPSGRTMETVLVFVNGHKTTKAESIESAQLAAKVYGCNAVYSIFNPQERLWNFARTAAHLVFPEIVDETSPAAISAAFVIKNLLESGKNVVVPPHSHGTFAAASAAGLIKADYVARYGPQEGDQKFQEFVKGRLSVETFGVIPGVRFPHGVDAVSFVSKWDLAGIATSFFTWVRGVFRGRNITTGAPKRLEDQGFKKLTFAGIASSIYTGLKNFITGANRSNGIRKQIVYTEGSMHGYGVYMSQYPSMWVDRFKRRDGSYRINTLAKNLAEALHKKRWSDSVRQRILKRASNVAGPAFADKLKELRGYVSDKKHSNRNESINPNLGFQI